MAALADTGLEKDCENAFVCCAPCGDWIANPVSTELVSCAHRGGDSNSTLANIANLGQVI